MSPISFLLLMAVQIDSLPDRRGWFESCSNRRSNAVPRTEVYVKSKMQCVTKCLDNASCHSANYFKEQNQKICVLFNEDLSLTQCDAHPPDQATTLLKLTNPCKNGFNFNRKTCDCGPAYGGEFCETPPTVTVLEYFVQSYGGFFEYIEIEGQLSQLTRGFHVMVYNDATATWSTQSYDTLGWAGLCPSIMAYIDSVSSGKLLMFVTSDEATTNMEQSLRDYLTTNYLSSQINNLQYRGAWILVGVKGGQKLLERVYNGAVHLAFPDPASVRFQLTAGNSEYYVAVL